MVYTMSDEEREQRSAQLVQLAMNEIRAFASKRNAPPLAKTARITDYQLRAFDLDLSNTPTFILSAKLPVPGKTTVRGGEFDYFVTVVARIDINGMPQKIFSSVTDSSYLDVFPQMELIDAVDADGPAGTLVRLEGDEVGPAVAERLSVHQVGVSDLVEAARWRGRVPPTLVLLGLVPQTTGLGVGLSPPVAAAFPRLLEAVREEAGRLGFILDMEAGDDDPDAAPGMGAGLGAGLGLCRVRTAC
jgi:hydrogenase maturation protease